MPISCFQPSSAPLVFSLYHVLFVKVQAFAAAWAPWKKKGQGSKAINEMAHGSNASGLKNLQAQMWKLKGGGIEGSWVEGGVVWRHQGPKIGWAS